MLIQRVILSFKQQAWTTLLLELLVVVSGILIALQVDNWNEHRKKVAEANEWRAQILVDLKETRGQLQSRIDYYTDASKFGESALAGLQAENELSDDEAWDLVLGAFQAGQIWPYRLTGPTYREAQNAGGLGLVGDAPLLTALSELYDITAHDFDQVTGGLPKYREMIRERTPWPIQEYIWDADCHATILHPGDGDFSFRLVDCGPPPLMPLIHEAAKLMRADIQLQQSLVGRLSQLNVSNRSMSRSVERIDYIIKSMEGGG